ncbi:S-crystallin 4 [Mizuhopecten yessoensis]|uniref:S-crystallin 4 n=3 Tax=Mizuhopecten yessoensis TaxID=6573 RepID=A0A210R6X0_MIZYE|nr:S-crystallin 4 [Mizuhopecten yessoensis]
MAAKYTITYFDAAGRAEVTRLAFAAKEVEFNDVRLTSDEWKKMKPSVPQGQLPIMEVESGGKKTVICQSGAMARFVAREFGLYGKNNMENSMVDVALETIEDLFKELIKIYTASDEKTKDELKAELGKTVVPKFVKNFEDMIGGKDWIVGSDMTIADLAVFSLFKTMPSMFGEDSTKCYRENKNLQAHAKRVSENKGIKKWLASQPVKK